MFLPKFEFYEPDSVEEVCRLLAKYGEKARLIAGGTDVIVNMKKKTLSPDCLISVAGVKELSEASSVGRTIKIGARFSVAELIESDIIKDKLPALSDAASNLGSPLVRNRATIGGNVGSARPAADLIPPLMAYGARVSLKSSGGGRVVPINDFFRAPGETEMRPDEVITEFQLDLPESDHGAGYINLCVRKTQDCNIVNAASFIELDKAGEKIETARVVLGCVGPTALRAVSAEKALLGKKPSEELFAEAGKAASLDCAPIDDFRGSGEYKRIMAGTLTERTLKIAFQQAKTGNKGEK